ncbi:hypothetical protein ACI65C_013677 [Semiaphis heraclei]
MKLHLSSEEMQLVTIINAAEFRDCLSTLGKVRDFFIYPKRKSVLHHQIESSSEISSKKTLKRSCETRWIERFHAVNDFIELYNHVIESLEIISEWVDSETSGKARTLRNAVLNLEFLVSLFVLNKGFSIGLPLSKLLQNPNIDLKVAVILANDTKQELQDLRKNAEEVFKDIFGQFISIS